MNSARMIFKYWLKSKRNFTKALILLIISTAFQLLVPIFIGQLVGRLDQNASNALDVRGLWTVFGIILGLSLLSFFIFRASRILSAEVSTRALYHIRKDIHDAIYRQSFAYFDKNETGQLVARATSDVEQSEMIFGFGLALGLQGLVQLVGIIITVSILRSPVSWVFAIIIPTSLLISLGITKKLKPIYMESREAFGELTNTMRENIVGSQVVRIFGMQVKERKKFQKNNSRFLDASVRSVKINSLYMPMNFVLIGIMVVFVLYYGGQLVIAGTMELATLVTFQSYIGLAIFPLVVLGQIMIMYVQADAALTRVREVLDSTPDIADTPDAVDPGKLKGEVVFDKVSFGYTSSNRILKDLSFKVAPGKKLAIIGTTGSGKSTIINLIPRFYEVNEGTISVDGVDIRKFKIAEYRKNIAIVSQDTFLFNRSIKENITFGKEDATMEEVIEASKTANIHEFIEDLPDGYETEVGEMGARLSGGQKQRLSIARALIIKPKILILDDSTSSVDVETEFRIQSALEQLMRDTTTFIITQRISTIRNADEIMVLDKGRIVGLGTHEDLIQDNVLYKQIYETLFRKQKELIEPAKKPVEVRDK